MSRRLRRCILLGLFVLGLALPGALMAQQQMFIYPDKGQSPEQQSRDRFECHTWAVQQTGFDPTAPQTAQAAPPPPPSAAPPPQGGVVKGAARGAAVGVVGGAIAGDAGKGAAIGAATGGMVGGMRQRDQAKQQQAQAQQQQQQAQAAAGQQSAARTASSENYNRAVGACLSGRGYTVR